MLKEIKFFAPFICYTGLGMLAGYTTFENFTMMLFLGLVGFMLGCIQELMIAINDVWSLCLMSTKEIINIKENILEIKSKEQINENSFSRN